MQKPVKPHRLFSRIKIGLLKIRFSTDWFSFFDVPGIVPTSVSREFSPHLRFYQLVVLCSFPCASSKYSFIMWSWNIMLPSIHEYINVKESSSSLTANVYRHGLFLYADSPLNDKITLESTQIFQIAIQLIFSCLNHLQ